MGEFFDRLETLPGMENVVYFRRQCEQREREGRRLYGHQHLSRDNAVDGTEEAADGAVYSHFLLLKARRERREEPTAAAFEAARYFALAHQALLRARHPDD